MSTIRRHGNDVITRVVDRFVADKIGAPFKVILHGSVEFTEDLSGNILKYNIPDLDGLLRAATMSRILCSRKLSGADIKFFRKALGIKQRDLAKSIEISPEHLSRCEAGTHPISPANEKLLRIYILKVVIKLHKMSPCKEKKRLDDALDAVFDRIKPIPIFDVNSELEFHFSRQPIDSISESGDSVDEGGGQWDEAPQMAA